MPDRIRLDGRVAVVTGAAGVIGTATIRLLAERGARIVAVDRREVQDGRIDIEKMNGPFLYVDRGHRQSIRRASRSLLNATGLNSTTAAPSSASRDPARTCSPKELASSG